MKSYSLLKIRNKNLSKTGKAPCLHRMRVVIFACYFSFFIGGLNAQNAPTVTSIIVEENNVSGGGFQSDVTITEDGLTVYSSADVSGISKSKDGGLHYETIGQGLKSPKVASLAITPDNSQILYAGTGDKGGSGGLFRSIDGGDTWSLTANGNDAQFAGNHSAKSDPIPDGHPRSNGDLIVVVPGSNAGAHTDDIVIAGTYKNGVVLFEQGGNVKKSQVNTSGFVRSVAYNAAIPNKVYAAIQFAVSANNGIYEIDFTNTTAPVSTLVYQTLRPEGLTVLNSGNVYAAISDKGIVKYDGTSWSLVNSGLSTNNPNRQWTAVTGYLKGVNDVVYAGTNNLGGTANGANYSSIWRTKDGGAIWTPLVYADSNVVDQIYGQSYDWWYGTDAFKQARLGRTNHVVSSIEVAIGEKPLSVFDDIIYVSGRGGIWKSDDGGRIWKPSVYNMQVTANRGVAVNPNNPDQIVIANTDYVLLETSNNFENGNVSRDKPPGAESRGYDVIFDATANEVILGAGDRDTNSPGGGEVYKKPANAVGNTSGSGWTNTNLRSATASNDGRVRAICYGYHNGNNPTSQTILAAVEGEGVYRYHNGTWTKSTGITIGSTDGSNFVWPDNGNSGVVYLVDLSAGLYRSIDGGRTWTDIWPSMKFNNNDFFNTGYITADDNAPTTIYLSIQGRSGSPIGTKFKVFRLTGANTGVFGALGSSNIKDITRYSGNSIIQRPGPIVFGPKGRLWLTQQQNSSNSIDAGLFVMENPATDVSFKDITTNEYRNIAIQPSGIDVSSDGYIYISQSGTGVVKIKYIETGAPATCNLGLWLEGALDLSSIKMTNNLQQKGVLPSGQPYQVAPWNYNGTEGGGWQQSDYPAGAIDWVLVSLRTTPQPSSEVAKAAALLMEDGSILPTDIELNGVSATAFYIVVEHRNHIPAMTPVAIPLINNELTYDFRIANSYNSGAGFGQTQFGNEWALFAGEISQSSTVGYEVTGADYILWQSANGNFATYRSEDVNLDSDVNGLDRILLNVNNGISSAVMK